MPDLQQSIDSVDSFDGPSIQAPNTEKHVSIDVNTYDTKMISLSKSKEYSKLANQIPGIYNIESGQKILNNNNLRGAGINPVNTLHEKYRENIKDLKQFQSTSRYQTSSRGFQQTRNAQNRATSYNVSSIKADKSPVRDRLPHLQMELQKTLLQRGAQDQVLNDGVQGTKPLYRTKINEVSTPLIKNKRRFGPP